MLSALSAYRLRREITGFVLIALWMVVVTAFAFDFEWDARTTINLLDVYTVRTPVELFLTGFIAASGYSVVIAGVVAVARTNPSFRTMAYAIVGIVALAAFALFAKLAVDYQYVFSVNRLSGGIVAVLIFVAGLFWIVIARLIQLATGKR